VCGGGGGEGKEGASGHYKADQDSEGASEDDIVVYTGVLTRLRMGRAGGIAVHTGVCGECRRGRARGRGS
jgi:hypothetical protein